MNNSRRKNVHRIRLEHSMNIKGIPFGECFAAKLYYYYVLFMNI